MSGKEKKRAGKKAKNTTNQLGLSLRLAQPEDAEAFHKFCAEVVKTSYLEKPFVNGAGGFDEEKFLGHKLREYFVTLSTPTSKNASILAEIDGKIIGCVTIQKTNTHNKIIGPHIARKYQGLGVSFVLWPIIEGVIAGQPAVTHIPATAWATLNFYQLNRFRINPRSPHQVLKPEWLIDSPGLLEYQLIRDFR